MRRATAPVAMSGTAEDEDEVRRRRVALRPVVVLPGGKRYISSRPLRRGRDRRARAAARCFFLLADFPLPTLWWLCAATSATEAKVAEGSGGSGGSEFFFVPSIYLVFYKTAENQRKKLEKNCRG